MSDKKNKSKSPSFTFEGINIEKIIAHRIYSKDPTTKESVPPKLSSQLITLEPEAMDALENRMQEALGSKSNGIEMTVADGKEEHFFQTAAKMLHADDNKTFINLSATFAERLTEAQYNTKAPGGILVIISGRVGANAKPFLAVIKAEPHDGFITEEKDGNVLMRYIADLLLSKNQRLYKIGFVVEIVSASPIKNVYKSKNYRFFLYDHLMTATETRKAALYFYNIFLGMSIQASEKKITQDFFDNTRLYIETTDLTNDEKLGLREALRVELRSQKATINIAEFAKDHFPPEMRQNYVDFMYSKGLPKNAFNKDNNYIQNKLKRRRSFPFSNGVKLITPGTDDAKSFFNIQDNDEEGETTVVIKGAFLTED